MATGRGESSFRTLYFPRRNSLALPTSVTYLAFNGPDVRAVDVALSPVASGADGMDDGMDITSSGAAADRGIRGHGAPLTGYGAVSGDIDVDRNGDGASSSNLQARDHLQSTANDKSPAPGYLGVHATIGDAGGAEIEYHNPNLIPISETRLADHPPRSSPEKSAAFGKPADIKKESTVTQEPIVNQKPAAIQKPATIQEPATKLAPMSEILPQLSPDGYSLTIGDLIFVRSVQRRFRDGWIHMMSNGRTVQADDGRIYYEAGYVYQEVEPLLIGGQLIPFSFAVTNGSFIKSTVMIPFGDVNLVIIHLFCEKPAAFEKPAIIEKSAVTQEPIVNQKPAAIQEPASVSEPAPMSEILPQLSPDGFSLTIGDLIFVRSVQRRFRDGWIHMMNNGRSVQADDGRIYYEAGYVYQEVEPLLIGGQLIPFSFAVTNGSFIKATVMIPYGDVNLVMIHLFWESSVGCG